MSSVTTATAGRFINGIAADEMKNTILIVKLCILAFLCHADDVIIPGGITYKRTADSINQEAITRLEKLFRADAAESEILSLFKNEALICGPGLWRELKDDPELSALDTGKVDILVPKFDKNGEFTGKYELTAKLLQSSEEVMLFWKAFIRHTDFSNLRPRKLNQIELRIFWAMIPFVITEPLFILESEKHRLLVVFASPENLRIVWIDDFQRIIDITSISD